MAISHNRRLIHLHPSRTAGKAIELALFPDEVTEKTNRQDAHFGLHKADHRTLQRMIEQHAGERALGGGLTEAQARDYRKLIIVRDPFDRALSHFLFWLGGISRRTRSGYTLDAAGVKAFLQTLRTALDKEQGHLDTQYAYTLLGEEVAPHVHVLRFVEFPDCFNHLMQKWDMEARVERKVNSHGRDEEQERLFTLLADDAAIREEFQREIVALFAADFDHFGFSREFDPAV